MILSLQFYIMNRKLLCLIIPAIFATSAWSQKFSPQITTAANSILKKLSQPEFSSKKKIAFLPFTDADNTATYLGVYISGEMSAEISNNESNRQFTVLGSTNLDAAVRSRFSLVEDVRLVVKNMQANYIADFLVTGTIAEIDATFRVTVHLIDLSSGLEISTVRSTFDKTPNLVQYHAKRPVNQTAIAMPPQPKPESDCRTGDFCFENTTRTKKEVSIRGEEGALGRSTLYAVTLHPGEKGCFYNMPVKVWPIEISNFDAQGYYTGIDRKQIQVQKCAKEATLTPLKLY